METQSNCFIQVSKSDQQQNGTNSTIIALINYAIIDVQINDT